DLLKVFEPERSRLAAVPGEVDDRSRRGLDLLDDVALQHFVAHAKVVALRIKKFFLEVVAIMAGEVADRPQRLRHYLKFAQRRRHMVSGIHTVAKGRWKAKRFHVTWR